MKNKGFGHLKTRLFTIKTSKNVGLGAHGIYIHSKYVTCMLRDLISCYVMLYYVVQRNAT